MDGRAVSSAIKKRNTDIHTVASHSLKRYMNREITLDQLADEVQEYLVRFKYKSMPISVVVEELIIYFNARHIPIYREEA